MYILLPPWDHQSASEGLRQAGFSGASVGTTKLQEAAGDRNAAFTRQKGRKRPEGAVFSGPVMLPRKRSVPIAEVILSKMSPGTVLIPRQALLPFVIQITIRAANVSDTDTIAQFNSRMAWETEERRLDADCVRAGVAALLIDATKGTYFVGEAPGANAPVIAGQLLITHEWSDWRNGDFWWIQSVYVAKEFRGKGVFRALFNHVHTLAKARRDVCGLRLYMDAHNETARRTYERAGLKQTNYQMFEMDFASRSRLTEPSQLAGEKAL